MISVTCFPRSLTVLIASHTTRERHRLIILARTLLMLGTSMSGLHQTEMSPLFVSNLESSKTTETKQYNTTTSSISWMAREVVTPVAWICCPDVFDVGLCAIPCHAR